MNEVAKEAKKSYPQKVDGRKKSKNSHPPKEMEEQNPEKAREYQERYWKNKIARMNKEED